MRNITVAVDNETYTRARVAAAERDTSVSALVRAYLEQLAEHETETERLKGRRFRFFVRAGPAGVLRSGDKGLSR